MEKILCGTVFFLGLMIGFSVGFLVCLSIWPN